MTGAIGKRLDTFMCVPWSKLSEGDDGDVYLPQLDCGDHCTVHTLSKHHA